MVAVMVRIIEVVIDDANEVHVTRHGISISEVVQVLMNGPQVRRNRRGRSATHVARGVTDGGRIVLIPFANLGDGRVRPLTAWEVGK